MDSSKKWELRVKESVAKDIAGFPDDIRKKVLHCITFELAQNPFSGDIEKMKGEDNVWRRRIGSYRIFYELFPRESVVYVFRVKRRSSKTY